MKAQVKVGPRVIIEIEGAKQKDVFKAMASAHEVFGEKRCGLCESEEIKPVWRTVSRANGKKMETFEYPEYKCEECFATLALGTINDDTGTLYPQRKLSDDGKPLTKEQREKGEGRHGKHRGWHKWVKEADANREE